MKSFLIQILLATTLLPYQVQGESFLKFTDGSSERIRSYKIVGDSLSYYGYGDLSKMTKNKSDLDQKLVHIDEIEYFFDSSVPITKYLVKLENEKEYQFHQRLYSGEINAYKVIKGMGAQAKFYLYAGQSDSREVYLLTHNSIFSKENSIESRRLKLIKLLEKNAALVDEVELESFNLSYNNILKILERYYKETNQLFDSTNEQSQLILYSSLKNKNQCVIEINKKTYKINPREKIVVNIPSSHTVYLELVPDSPYRDGYLVSSTSEFPSYFEILEKNPKREFYFLLNSRTSSQFSQISSKLKSVVAN
jgi:hypothetical protein